MLPSPLAYEDHNVRRQMTKPTNEMLSNALIRKVLGGLLVTGRSAADDIAVGDIFER